MLNADVYKQCKDRQSKATNRYAGHQYTTIYPYSSECNFCTAFKDKYLIIIYLRSTLSQNVKPDKNI